MKINQIAIQVPNINEARKIMFEIFGSTFDMDDHLTMDGSFSGMQSSCDVHLSFDFGLLGNCDEFEFISSKDESHWHSGKEPGFLSHLGVYCCDQKELDSAMYKIESYGFNKLQDSISSMHSRKNQDGTERSYRDVIYNTSFALGFNIKLSLKILKD